MPTVSTFPSRVQDQPRRTCKGFQRLVLQFLTKRVKMKIIHSEGRSLYISFFIFPCGKEKRELSKRSHTSGQIALATDWWKLGTGMSSHPSWSSELIAEKNLSGFFFLSWFPPKSVARNRRELTPRKDGSGVRSSRVKLWRWVQDAAEMEKSRGRKGPVILWIGSFRKVIPEEWSTFIAKC